jgi:hypothetical protein
MKRTRSKLILLLSLYIAVCANARYSLFPCGVEAEDEALPALGTVERYSKALEYEYRVKTAALFTLKRYYIFSLTLYLEWYSAYSIVGSGGPTS